MAILNKPCLILAFILTIHTVFLSDKLALADSCDDQLGNLISECLKYVQWVGSNPGDASPDCCAVVKLIDTKCACEHVTEDIEFAIDMAKAVAVFAKCGRPIPPGTQCGTYRVPMA